MVQQVSDAADPHWVAAESTEKNGVQRQESAEVSDLKDMVQKWQVNPISGNPRQKRSLSSGPDVNRKQKSNGERGHRCADCGKFFLQASNFIQHRRIHTGEKPFKCGECGKSYNQRVHLTQHQRVHTGEKPYKCQVCGKAFRVSSHLVQHHSVHSGERPYGCNECGKSFGRHSHLIEHLKRHLREKSQRCTFGEHLFQEWLGMDVHLLPKDGGTDGRVVLPCSLAVRKQGLEEECVFRTSPMYLAVGQPELHSEAWPQTTTKQKQTKNNKPR